MPGVKFRDLEAGSCLGDHGPVKYPDSWIIILAPESSIPEDDPWGGIPALTPEAVAPALESCSFLKRDGNSIEGEGLDRIEWPPEGVKYVCVNGTPSRSRVAVAAMAESLVRAVGPVTVVDSDFILMIEVKAPMRSNEILSRPDSGWSSMSENPKQFP